jgi:hypothetical protein
MSRKFAVYNQQIWCRKAISLLYVDSMATLASRLSTEKSLRAAGELPSVGLTIRVQRALETVSEPSDTQAPIEVNVPIGEL